VILWENYLDTILVQYVRSILKRGIIGGCERGIQVRKVVNCPFGKKGRGKTEVEVGGGDV
jgi:hypothetical protein